MKNGAVAAITAYVLWGLLPLYMHLALSLPVFEVLAHRIIWALPTVLLILVFMGGLRDLARLLRYPKIVARSALTAFIITCNWGTYIWAIVTNHTLDAALGYYIAPLFSILLGACFLKERLNFWQWFAFCLAFAVVTSLALRGSHFPWVALIIASSFSIYGFLKKSLPVTAAQGFALEACILFIPALCVALYYVHKGDYHFAHGSWSDNLLLIGMGPLTALPLILFASGAQRLSLTALGLMQYISPTLVFLVAIFVLRESFSWSEFWAFILIWISIIIYSLANIQKNRQARARANQNDSSK